MQSARAKEAMGSGFTVWVKGLGFGFRVLG